MGVAAIYHNIDENDLSDGTRGGIVFVLLVSFYWCMLGKLCATWRVTDSSIHRPALFYRCADIAWGC